MTIKTLGIIWIKTILIGSLVGVFMVLVGNSLSMFSKNFFSLLYFALIIGIASSLVPLLILILIGFILKKKNIEAKNSLILGIYAVVSIGIIFVGLLMAQEGQFLSTILPFLLLYMSLFAFLLYKELKKEN